MPSLPAGVCLGVDVGGTFTDFALWRDGRLAVYKLPSTPDDPARALLAGLLHLQAQPDTLVHGSTIATNALIEGKGAPTALITTRGFRDVLVIGRQTRPKLYDLAPRRPPPLIPDELRLEADERLDYRGHVLQPLDPQQVDRLLDQLQAAGVESLAVSFLFSFLNPEHERLVAQRAHQRGLFVSPSHEVLPEHREYERTATTAANAYLAPVMARYLERLSQGLSQRGIRHLRIMHSNGGSLSPQAAIRLPVRTALSGPAAGVAAAFHIARQAFAAGGSLPAGRHGASGRGFPHIISLDMGGTSTDVSLCPGRILDRDETRVGDLPLRGPTVDVVSVGAGGGSLARLDEGGALRVGPQSAGADPGPACYGKAIEPTVTDAHLVLGRLDPATFLGGRMAIDADRSFQALAALAPAFDGDIAGAADALLRVANANMERALRIVSVERGHDPRLFTLVAFGGAGPLHACYLAQSLRIPRVLVPPYPGVLSALGTLVAPPSKDLLAAVMLPVPPQPGDDWARIETTLAHRFDELLRRGLDELAAEGFPTDGLIAERFLDMRYQGQSYELTLPVDTLKPAAFLPTFHELHRQRYAHADPARPTEVVNLRLKLTVPTETPALPSLPEGGPDPSPALIDHRPVWFDSPLPRRERDRVRVYDTPAYHRSRLLAGMGIDGPALVLQMDATTAIPPGWRAQVDAWGNLLLELGRP